jgi:hypothetical protein
MIRTIVVAAALAGAILVGAETSGGLQAAEDVLRGGPEEPIKRLPARPAPKPVAPKAAAPVPAEPEIIPPPPPADVAPPAAEPDDEDLAANEAPAPPVRSLSRTRDADGRTAAFFARPTLNGEPVYVDYYRGGAARRYEEAATDRFCQRMGFSGGAYYALARTPDGPALEDVLCVR